MRAALTIVACLSSYGSAKTIDESNTGALLSFPSVLDGPLYNRTWEVAPAQFGYQKYGGALEGWLVLPLNESYHMQCPGEQEPLDKNPYQHFIQDWFVSAQDIKEWILVIDRRDCYFVDKIEHAQQMGASGVLMCDQKNESLFTMWMPNDWNDELHIPSVLLDHKDCGILMKHLGVQNWDPVHPDQMKYPTTETMNWTIATIEWGLPHPDDRVEYELWTSSNDYLGSKFKHTFNDTAIALDQAGDTQFTPHMYILNGSHWGCDSVVNGSHTLQCRRQCSNSGRYCAVDPEFDMDVGLDGIDVIQENLRSLCVWQYDKQQFDGDDVMWWDYAVLWDENCGVWRNESDEAQRFNEDCAYVQMDLVAGHKKLSSYVKQCITDSGGYGYEDGVNTLLQKETRLKENSSIYAVPMVRVNEFLIHGNIDCDQLPVTTSNCVVLGAVCAGFLPGTEPQVCDLTPAPTMVTCEEADKDCLGVCFGTNQMDRCGQCLLVSSHEFDKCVGCNDVVNATYDCEMTCGGFYKRNQCDYCKDSRLSGWETYGQDCNGGCSTTLSLDKCGVCLEDGASDRDACVGCDQVANSNKELNECGFCELKTDTNFHKYGKDCTGECAVTQTYYVDECGQCLLTKDSKWNSCIEEASSSSSGGGLGTGGLVIVAIIAVVIIVVVALIAFALWKKQKTINERFDSLAATYVHMDENPKHGGFPVRGTNTKVTKMPVPDAEEE